jgi:hypothetical protein
MHYLDIYHGCIVSCRYQIPASEQAPKESLEHALVRTVLQHPLLQLGLRGETTKKLCWIRLDSIDLQQHIKWRTLDHGEHFETEYEASSVSNLDRQFQDLDKRPAWHVTVFLPPETDHALSARWVEVLFNWNHNIGDGMSGRIFHESLLRHLNHDSSSVSSPQVQTLQLKDHVLRLPPTSHVPPPQERLIHFPISPGYFLKTLLTTLRSTPQQPKDTSWISKLHTPLRNKMASFVISAPAASRILSACRARGTTLTGLLHALLLVAFSSKVGESTTKTFQSGTPISLRPFAEAGKKSRQSGYEWLVPHQTIVNTVSYVTHDFPEDVVGRLRKLCVASTDVKPGTDDNQGAEAKPESDVQSQLEDTIWEVAADVRAQLKRKVDGSLKNEPVGKLRFVDDWVSSLQNRTKLPMTLIWEISNLGAIEDSGYLEDGKLRWTMESASFSQSSCVNGPAATYNVIGMKGGGVTVICTWQDGVLDDELCVGVTRAIETRLDYLGRTGRLI